MKFKDIISMALLGIQRQKTRTALSLIGVVVGSLMLLFALAARGGVQEAVMRVFSMNKQLREIMVSQNWSFDEKDIPEEELVVGGELDEAVRSRIRNMLIRHWQYEHQGKSIGLTRERIKKIESLNHVQSIYPHVSINVMLEQGQNELHGYCASAEVGDEVLQERILAGKAFESNSEKTILLNEFVAWRWGYSSLSEIRKLIGTKVQMVHRSGEENVAYSLARRSGGDIKLSKDEIVALNSVFDRLPAIVKDLNLPEQERAALKKAFPSPISDPSQKPKPSERIITEEFTVAGIFRGPTEEETKDEVNFGRGNDLADFLLPIKTATQYALRIPYINKSGFHSATILVDHESHLKSVSGQIRKMGFRVYSLASLIELIQKQVQQVTLIVSLIAIFALVISAVGIANTMVMSVVERTREIGIMKSLGAREGQIQMLFLVEGALIGLIGGVCALAIGLAIKIPIESLIISILESEWNRTFKQEQVIEFPLWLLALVLAFSMVVTILATILPARRAARIDPIAALRHD